MGSTDAMVSWQQDVDLSNVEEKRSEIDGIIDQQHPTRLVIDLGQLEFIDSLGLGVLIYTRDRCDESACELILRAVPDRTLRLLVSAGLDGLFTLERATDPA